MQVDDFGQDNYVVMIPIMYDVVLDELNCFEIRTSPTQVGTIIASAIVSTSFSYPARLGT